MSIAALILAEIYILTGGGELLEPVALLKLLGVMLLSVFAGSSMVFPLCHFLKAAVLLLPQAPYLGHLSIL